MNTRKTHKPQTEWAFSAALVTLLLIVLPMCGQAWGKSWGAIAMLAVAVVGAIAYIVVYRDRLHGRFLKTVTVVASASFAIAAAIALVLPLIR